jgi:uncharacterized protein YutE (UPF0331/DUF86 family)
LSVRSWRAKGLVDNDLLVAKASSLKRHMKRVEDKCETDLKTFLSDIDRQEIVIFNLQMAIQNCIDIAAHIISEEGLGVPGSISEMFYLLEENSYLDNQITEKMVKAVGFRNLIVHEYARIEIKQIFDISTKNITDLNDYLKSIFKKVGIA